MEGSNYPVFGGLTLSGARDIHREAAGIDYAFKNLFYVSVASPVPIGALGLATGRFNFFCIGAEYSPITLTGDKRQVGAAFVDALRSAEPIELRLTTLDNRNGMIKKWFESLAALCAPVDGTVNPPGSYASKITVRHSRITDSGGGILEVLTDLDVDDAYSSTAIYRPGALENSLSRQDAAVEELSMTFVQLDTFMPTDIFAEVL